MKSTRQKMFAGYADWVIGQGGNPSHMAKRLIYVRYFLNNARSVTQKGLSDLLKMDAAGLCGNGKGESGIHAVKDFLRFMNRGMPEASMDDPQPLKRLDDIAAENRASVNSFVEWMDTELDLSASTVNAYSTGLIQFFRYSNEFSLDSAKRFVATLEEKGFKPQTVSNRMSALEKYGEYIGKPIRMRRPKIRKTLNVENVPTEREYRKLCDWLKEKQPLHYLWVRLLATTGARVSEFVQFRWADVLSGEVTLRGKGNKYRRFFFQKEVIDECRAWLGDRDADGPVAVNRYGDLISTRGIAELMRGWAVRCGIEKSKIHPHAFRHFFAKMYLKRTNDIVKLADIMGHGSIETTRIYLQRSYDEQKRDFNRAVTW